MELVISIRKKTKHKFIQETKDNNIEQKKIKYEDEKEK